MAMTRWERFILSMEKHPNIVFIVADQWRKQAAGFWASPTFREHLREVPDPVFTPNIDRLAEESVVFSQATSSFPLCAPYRGMMLTGQLPHKNGVILNCHSGRPTAQLKEEVPCVSDILKKEGYSMGYIGKLHTDFPTPNVPQTGGYAEAPRDDGNVWDAYTPPGPKRHGFDYWYSYGAYDEHLAPHYWDTKGEFHQPGVWSPQHEADRAIDYIRNDAGQRADGTPFGLWVSINPPHNPYDQCLEIDQARYAGKTWEELAIRPNVDPDHAEMQAQIANYFAMVTGIDREIGRILDELKAQGILEETLIVLTADHGEAMGSQGLMNKNHPYVESTDIPLMIRLPGAVAPRVEDLLLGTCDLMPTVLGLAGFEQKIPPEVDGVNYAGWIRNEATEVPRPEASVFFRHVNAAPDADGKVRDFVVDTLGLKTHRHTYWVCSADAPGGWACDGLFDIVEDPYQMNNLHGTDPKLEQSLIDTLVSVLPHDFPCSRIHPEVRKKLQPALKDEE